MRVHECLVLPESLREQIVYALHDHPMSAHLAQQKRSKEFNNDITGKHEQRCTALRSQLQSMFSAEKSTAFSAHATVFTPAASAK